MSEEPTSADDKPNFSGRYALVRNENLDQFLRANGEITNGRGLCELTVAA